MNSTLLLQEILRKISRYKVLIIVVGILIGGLLFIKTKRVKTEYTSLATVFPLTNPTDNALGGGALSSLLGVSDAQKSFSSEASINIIELALSRNVRETLAATRIPRFGNKMIAELMVNELNSGSHLLSKKIEYPDDSVARAVLGGQLLQPNIGARINKNGVLELNFTSTDSSLVTPISNLLISIISQFYINLRIEKAKADYAFILTKIDSVQDVLDHLDAKAVNLSNTTMFTPADRLEYSLPKENLSDERLRITTERDVDINSREEALWRLQKITPIVAILDKPNPPFDIKKPSAFLYGFIGLLLGCFLTIFIVIADLLIRFIKSEISKAVTGDQAASVASTKN